MVIELKLFSCITGPAFGCVWHQEESSHRYNTYETSEQTPKCLFASRTIIFVVE